MTNLPTNQRIPEPAYGPDIPFSEFGEYKSACQQSVIEWFSKYQPNSRLAGLDSFTDEQIFQIGDSDKRLANALFTILGAGSLLTNNATHDKFSTWIYAYLSQLEQTHAATGFVPGYGGILLSRMLTTELMRRTFLQLLVEESEFGAGRERVQQWILSSVPVQHHNRIATIMEFLSEHNTVDLPAREHLLLYGWLGCMLDGFPEEKIISALGLIIKESFTASTKEDLVDAKSSVAHLCYPGKLIAKLDLLERYEAAIDSEWAGLFGGESIRYLVDKDLSEDIQDGDIAKLSQSEVEQEISEVYSTSLEVFKQIKQTLASEQPEQEGGA